ncbi:small multi-drug export protein [bacterium]|nr:small multi-drug export protein [bacterium]
MDGFWQWVEGLNPVVAIIVLTYTPIFELRASVPYGIFLTDLPLWQVLLTAILSNWAVAPVVYLFLKYLMRFILHWKWFARLWERYTVRFQQRIHRAVEGKGAWGLALFIGVPLPGSGVYAGALAAYLLGMGFRRFMLMSLCGVIMAASIVAAIALSGGGLADLLLKTPAAHN